MSLKSKNFIEGASIKSEEEEFARVLEARAKASDGKIKVVDIYKKESEIEVQEITTLSKVVEWVKETYPGFVHQRIPVYMSKLTRWDSKGFKQKKTISDLQLCCSQREWLW